MDVADFLQVLPTVEGRSYLTERRVKAAASGKAVSKAEIEAPCESRLVITRCTPVTSNPFLSLAVPARAVGTDALVAAWKASTLFERMVHEMEMDTVSTSSPTGMTSLLLLLHSFFQVIHILLCTFAADVSLKAPVDIETGDATTPESQPLSPVVVKEWPEDFRQRYPGSFWYHFRLTLDRQRKLVTRDSTFLKARIGQNLIIGAIAGSLFSNIATTDVTTMNGFLFFTALNGALGGFSMMPQVYAQKLVHYKHAGSLFYPTAAFTLAQAIVYYPLHLVEAILFCTIM
jgi:hypothetical protein